MPRLLAPWHADLGISKVLKWSLKEGEPESKSVDALVSASEQLLLKNGNGRIDTRTEAGTSACEAFLEVLANTAASLGLQPADRSFRADFSRNYRALFPDCQRRYRVDVLEACLERFDCFWVNGERFAIAQEVLFASDSLHEAWRELGELLKSWPQRRNLAKLRKALERLDELWAVFEHGYINELIRIEQRARAIVSEVGELEARLLLQEKAPGQGSEDSAELRDKLASRFAFINSVANVRRKGRADMTVEVLNRAYSVLEGVSGSVDVCRHAAVAVTTAFEQLRVYFRQASQSLDRIDPYLGHNRALVDRLCAYEEAWEIANDLFSNQPRVQVLNNVVARLQQLSGSDARFNSMIEDREAELFLVLPRLVWLFALESPETHVALLADLLPESDPELGSAVQSLTDKFHSFVARFSATCAGHCHMPAIGVLVARAVHGEGELPEVSDPAVAERLTALMLDLEGWSMKLQRHCPDDWNRCCALLLNGLDAGFHTAAVEV